MKKVKNKKNIGLIILSALDFITGALSFIITTFVIQILAIMSSGLTLLKSIKVAIQSEKTAVIIKPMAIYAIKKLSRSEKMKNFFKKIKENIKNNPITLITSIIELLICGGLSYVLLGFFGKFEWAIGWKLYLAAFGSAFVIYTILAALTIFLGHDNPLFASIRKFVKLIGGDKAVKVLDKANDDVDVMIKADLARAEAEAKLKAEEDARKAEEDKIYEYAMQREKEKRDRIEQERRRNLINLYKNEFNASDKKNI